LLGLEEYLPFLKQFARDDTTFSEAYERYAPGYFSMWCRNIYNLALMQATQRNQPAKATANEAFTAIGDVLQRVSPELLPAL
jgi:hypothetical protein